jgi:hypothetical protein
MGLKKTHDTHIFSSSYTDKKKESIGEYEEADDQVQDTVTVKGKEGNRFKYNQPMGKLKSPCDLFILNTSPTHDVSGEGCRAER